jgi:hypothetical protein
VYPDETHELRVWTGIEGAQTQEGEAEHVSGNLADTWVAGTGRSRLSMWTTGFVTAATKAGDMSLPCTCIKTVPSWVFLDRFRPSRVLR